MHAYLGITAYIRAAACARLLLSCGVQVSKLLVFLFSAGEWMMEDARALVLDPRKLVSRSICPVLLT